MEEFRTYRFEKTKKRTKKQWIRDATIFGGIITIFILVFLGLPTIGIFTALSFAFALLGMKVYNDKYMGINAYGERREKIVITETFITIGDAKIPFSELEGLVIYVDEYAGMPRALYGVHHGGNNEIIFEHKGHKHSFNYIIKNRADFKKVEKLVKRIEMTY